MHLFGAPARDPASVNRCALKSEKLADGFEEPSFAETQVQILNRSSSG